MTKTLAAALAASAAAAVLLTGCGGGNAPAATAPPAGTTAANTLVCRHYLAQRAWVKNLTFPTLADALKFGGYVAADAAQSTGKLHADLTAMSADEQAGRSSYAASKRVYGDCA